MLYATQFEMARWHRRLLFRPIVLEFVSNLTHYSKFPVTRFMFVLSPLPFLLATSPLSLLCATIFTLFGCFQVVTLSSRHPSRAAWTRRLGCLGRMCSLTPPPPSLLPDVPNLQPFKHQASSISRYFRTTPSRATLARRLGCLGGGARGFSSRLVAREPSVLCPGL